MEYLTYILQSEISGRLYIGHTADIVGRLIQHNTGRNISTKGRGPWKLLFTIKFNTRSEAILLEKKLKAFKSGKKVLGWIDRASVSRQ